MTTDVKTETRTVERGVAGSGQTGAEIAQTAHKPGGTVVVVGGLKLTGQQIKDDVGGVADGARKAVDSLGQSIPTQFRERQTIRGRKPNDGEFILAMADLQEQYATELGHLTTDPKILRNGAEVATAADDAISPIDLAVTVLTNIRDFSLKSARHDANLIYERALSVAKSHPDIAKVIAKYKDPASRIAAKGAATKKKNRAEQAKESAKTEPETAPSGGTTTTITTTTK